MMPDIPIIPKVEEPEPPPEPEQDTTVHTDRAKILAAIDDEGKLYSSPDIDFAIGPGNLRYSLEVLEGLEADGEVRHKHAPDPLPGNEPSTTITWVRA